MYEYVIGNDTDYTHWHATGSRTHYSSTTVYRGRVRTYGGTHTHSHATLHTHENTASVELWKHGRIVRNDERESGELGCLQTCNSNTAPCTML